MVLQHRLGGYREYTAPAALAPYCEAVWTYRTPSETSGAVHRVLPDPAVNIELVYLRDRAGQVCEPRLVVGGPIGAPEVAAFEPRREIVALKVKLEWSEEVRERVPRLTRLVLDRLHHTTSLKEATDLLVRCVVPHDRVSGVAARALDIVRWTRGRCTIERIAEELTVSPRHLRRAVEREAGVTLKGYARTLRLLRAVTIADAYPVTRTVPWASLAADTGFYDQSHLIRECHDLCGLTPSAILNERRAEVDLTADRIAS
jgi:AraC-like DNA-binding protein